MVFPKQGDNPVGHQSVVEVYIINFNHCHRTMGGIADVFSTFGCPVLNALRSFATKSKTNKSAYKRFRQLEDGNYSYKKAGQNHNFAKKSAVYRSRVRQMGITTPVVTRKLEKLHVSG